MVIERVVREFTIFNPRRSCFDSSDKTIEQEQIIWEYEHLLRADAIIMFLCKETLGPISLYELGRHINCTNKKAYVVTEKGYQRTNDVIIQTALSRPDVLVVGNVYGIENMVGQCAHFINHL
jgi:hypothetical protein